MFHTVARNAVAARKTEEGPCHRCGAPVVRLDGHDPGGLCPDCELEEDQWRLAGAPLLNRVPSLLLACVAGAWATDVWTDGGAAGPIAVGASLGLGLLGLVSMGFGVWRFSVAQSHDVDVHAVDRFEARLDGMWMLGVGLLTVAGMVGTLAVTTL